jgi:hypothetical protein
MKKNKKIIESLLFLFFTIILLLTSTFAWLSVNTSPKNEEFVIPLGKKEVSIVLRVKKNNEALKDIITEEDMGSMFDNTLPGDEYRFQLTIGNLSSSDIYTNIYILNIRSVNSNEGFNMLDVFYIGENKIIDLIDENNSLYIENDLLLPLNEQRTIEFIISYNSNTSAIEYQKGSISVQSIVVYMS